MKILILSCNTGQGHNSAASSVFEEFTENGQECVSRDALEFLSKKFSDFICSWHMRIYQHVPVLFDQMYGFSKKHTSFLGDGPVYGILATGSRKLEKFVCAERFDAIFCTHPFASLMVTAMLEKHPHPEIKTGVVSTDYTCLPGISESKMDFYFAAHKKLVGEFVKAGIPKKKVIPCGIPVKNEFFDKLDKAEAKRRAEIENGKKHILIMSGSMGTGPLAELVETLLRKLPENIVLSVVCGMNEKLKERLDGIDDKRLQTLGYTDKVSLLMDSADLYITKAGGLSTTEAVAKELPMVFFDAVSGCEAYNRAFFVSEGVALAPTEEETTSDICARIINDDELLQTMSEKMQKNFPKRATKTIYKCFTE